MTDRMFGTDIGEIGVSELYADNAIYCREVSFLIPEEKWSEFEALPAYRDLAAWVSSLETQYGSERMPVLRWPDNTEELRRMAEDQAVCESLGKRIWRWWKRYG